MNREKNATRRSAYLLLATALLCAGMAPAIAVHAQTGEKVADGAEANVMQGFPPPDDELATRANSLRYPYLRWSLRNTRMLIPTANVESAGEPLPLPDGPRLDPDAVQFTIDGTTLTIADWLRRTCTDGFIVVHDGRIVMERYFDGFGPRQTHAWASMTKSVTGLVAAQLIAEGKLDPDAPLSSYVPELAGTPFGGATLQQNLDMEVAVRYPADLPPDLGLFGAVGIVPRHGGAPDSIYGFLKAAQTAPDVTSGHVWYYQNGSPEAVAWAIRRVTGESWSERVGRTIWGKLAQDDGDVVIDRTGTEMASGGFNTTLRDAARFGELVRRSSAGGTSLFPAPATRLALKPVRNATAFAHGNLAPGRPGYSYHDYWYQLNDGDGSFAAGGRFGQAILVDPRARLTIVKFSSLPDQEARPTNASGEAVVHAPLETADALHRAMLAIAQMFEGQQPQ
jgi:CubicO group peptidase (beta-lactamase class C family)